MVAVSGYDLRTDHGEGIQRGEAGTFSLSCLAVSQLVYFYDVLMIDVHSIFRESGSP